MKFRLSFLFKVTALLALYTGIPWLSGNVVGLGYVLFVAVTLLCLVSFAPCRSPVVAIGIVSGTLLGMLWFWYANRAEPFHPKDRVFYLVLFSTLVATAGALIAFLFSLARRQPV